MFCAYRLTYAYCFNRHSYSAIRDTSGYKSELRWVNGLVSGLRVRSADLRSWGRFEVGCRERADLGILCPGNEGAAGGGTDLSTCGELCADHDRRTGGYVGRDPLDSGPGAQAYGRG